VIPIWIPITIFAAFAQNLRFMLQRHLKATELSTGGATLSRFLFSFPLVALIVLVYSSLRDLPLPATNPTFWVAALTGGLAQILATMCVVALFAHRSFAIGITFKKTEVMLTALIGLVVLGEAISPLGILAIAIGFAGVLLLSDPPKTETTPKGWTRFFNKASGLGIASGALFGVSAVGYRAASLSLPAEDVFLRASMTLAVVTAAQTLALGLWLLAREKGEVTRVVKSWRVSSLVGLTSMLGSLGWFTAFTLQTAAYVKALGQIELVFSFLASWLIFKEHTSKREGIGVALLVVSVLLILLAFA
jgi:drug/metabolite transporter (DMT)-like permease